MTGIVTAITGAVLFGRRGEVGCWRVFVLAGVWAGLCWPALCYNKNMKKRGRKKLPKVRTWQLLVILVPLVFVDINLLRANHVKMVELREAVLEADEGEDEAELSERLEKLKDFVFNNMVINVLEENGQQKISFGTGPFYLEHTYIRVANRALREAEEAMSSDENPNGNIYKEAGEVCRALALANGWTWDNANYMNCMLEEIQKYPSAEELHDSLTANLPSTELFRKNYASPVWAPTLTGFMLLITLVIIVVIFIRVVFWIVLRLSLLFV